LSPVGLGCAAGDIEGGTERRRSGIRGLSELAKLLGVLGL